MWKICAENNKRHIEQAIKEILTNNFDPILYLNSCYEEAVHPSDFYEKYVHELEKGIPKDIIWENGKVKHLNFTFYNFVNLIYNNDLKSDDIPFFQFDKYPDFWQFYFRPTNFDYSKFDVKWLLTFENDLIHKKLSGISQVKTALRDCLNQEYNEELGKLFVQFYLSKE